MKAIKTGSMLLTGLFLPILVIGSCKEDPPADELCQDGEVETRIRYEESLVPAGSHCNPETQTRTCVEGEFGEWSGTFTEENCRVEDYQNCGEVPHGGEESRTRYREASVPYGSECVFELQTRICDNGFFSEWTGTFTEESCTVGNPADCGAIPHGGQESRMRYREAVVPRGSECVSEIQTRTCENGVFTEWTGTFTEESCEVQDCVFPPDGIQARGPALIRTLYDYAPSVMLDADGIYKMWWCGEDPDRLPEIIDVIYYAESADGLNWGSPTKVLETAGPPHQGIWACDPSVVKASNGYYYMFYTSEGLAMGDNQIFLAWSADGIDWDYANGEAPVIPLLNPDGTYGIGQSSVLFIDGKFLHFYTDTTSGGNNVYVAESTNGGTEFTKLNGSQPVIQGVTAVDVKYLPSYDLFLVAAEGPGGQWKISFYLLNRTFQIVAHTEPEAGRFLNPCNHNPGLLGDPSGSAVDEDIVLVYFGSGTYTSDHPTPCWNPDSWDIETADFYTEILLNPDCQ